MFSTQAPAMLLFLALVFQTLLYCGKSWQIITSRPVDEALGGIPDSQVVLSDKNKKLTALRDIRRQACFVKDYDPNWYLEPAERDAFFSMVKNCSPIQIEKLKEKAGDRIAEYCKGRFNIIWLNMLNDAPPPARGAPKPAEPNLYCEFTPYDDLSTYHRANVPPGAVNNVFPVPPTSSSLGHQSGLIHHPVNTDLVPPPLGSPGGDLIPPPLSNNVPQAQHVPSPHPLDNGDLELGPPPLNSGKDDLPPPPLADLPIVSRSPKPDMVPPQLDNAEANQQGTPRPIQIRMQEPVEMLEGRYFFEPQIGNTATPPPPPELLRLLLMNGVQRNAAPPVAPDYIVPEDHVIRTPPAPREWNDS